MWKILVPLALGVLVVCTRRGAASAPVAAPGPAPVPTPTPLPEEIVSFDAILAGQRALLRIHLDQPHSGEGAALLAESGDELTVLGALRNQVPGALGFTCTRALLESNPAWWLQLDGRTLALIQPATRVPAGSSA